MDEPVKNYQTSKVKAPSKEFLAQNHVFRRFFCAKMSIFYLKLVQYFAQI